jgi:hypothetical protein
MSGGTSHRLIAVLGVVFVLLGTMAQPGEALDHGSMGLMTPKKTHLKKDFPPMAGVYPQEVPVQAFAFYNSWGCINYSYCNRHQFDVDVPEGYIESFKGTDIVSYGVRVTLSWEDPKTNDLDLFVGWAVESQSSGSPQGPCGTPVDEECQTLFPEVYSVVEPKPEDDPATEEDESKLPAETYISVVNHTGVNTGYTIDLQWFLIPFGSFKEFVPPKRTQSQREVTASKTPAPVSERDNDQPDPDTKILIPGKDGKLVEQTLDFLASGHRFKSEKAGTAPWVWVVTAVLSAIALGGFGILVWRRRRSEASA